MGTNITKITVSLPTETVRIADENWKELGFASRSDYIGAAIRKLGAREMLHGFKDELADIYAQLERTELKEMENHLAKIMFKVAMEMAQLGILLTSALDISYTEAERIRGKAFSLIKKSHGIISLSTAARNKVPLDE